MLIVNPILKGFNPDPSICRVGDTYYIATSTFEWFPGVQVHQSTNLVNWQLAGHILTKQNQIDMQGIPDSGGVWAPCLTYSDSLFYLVYSNVTSMGPTGWDVANYLITCPTIDGEWSQPVYLNSSGFDASLFHDDDGKKYLLYMNGGEHIKNPNAWSICLREYLPSEKKLSNTEHIVFNGSPIKLTEGPHLYKKDGYYYLLVAEGGTEYAHAATVARSRSLLGSYEIHPANPILSSYSNALHPLQKAGHASMVESKAGEWYLAHLTSRPIADEAISQYHNRGLCPLGRETAIQRLEWKDNWPYMVNGPLPSLEVAAPKDASNIKAIEPTSCHDDFANKMLDINWATLRDSSFKGIYSLSEREGFLRLYGKESLCSLQAKALVARRWQAFNFEATTALEFMPFNDKQEAGLTCYYNTMNWTTCCLTHNKAKGRVLTIVACDTSVISRPLYGNEIAIASDIKAIYLKVVVARASYSYSYSFDGKNWQSLGPKFDSRKLSDDHIFKQNMGFFTGAFVGLYAVDNFNRNLNADFDFFDYVEKS